MQDALAASAADASFAFESTSHIGLYGEEARREDRVCAAAAQRGRAL